jgi:hypothetical protein
LEGNFAEKFGKNGNFGLWRRKLFFWEWKHWLQGVAGYLSIFLLLLNVA